MNRAQKAIILIAVVATPAAAYSVFAPVKDSLCLSSGAATYRLAQDASSPDFRIKITANAAKPDLRVQTVDRAEIADFVLVDDGSSHGSSTACRSSAPMRTVALDTGAAPPDVTVELSTEPADYKIYVQSGRFSQQDAAALLAAIWKANQRDDITASIR